MTDKRVLLDLTALATAMPLLEPRERREDDRESTPAEFDPQMAFLALDTRDGRLYPTTYDGSADKHALRPSEVRDGLVRWYEVGPFLSAEQVLAAAFALREAFALVLTGNSHDIDEGEHRIRQHLAGLDAAGANAGAAPLSDEALTERLRAAGVTFSPGFRDVALSVARALISSELDAQEAPMPTREDEREVYEMLVAARAEARCGKPFMSDETIKAVQSVLRACQVLRGPAPLARRHG